MLKPRNLLWLIPIALLLTFPVWRLPLASFLEPRGGYDPDFGKQDKNVHNFAMDGVVILQNQAGHKTAEVRAKRAFTSDKPNEFVLSSVDADLFSGNDDKVNVVAETGIYNTETKLLTLENNVIVDRSSEGQKLFSDLLYYYGDDRKILSPGNTRLVGKNIEIKGTSLDYDIVTSQYKVGGRVFCTIQGFNQP